jgi:hypothetical protein
MEMGLKVPIKKHELKDVVKGTASEKAPRFNGVILEFCKV